MKKSYSLITLLFCTMLSPMAISSEDDKVVQDLRLALENMAKISQNIEIFNATPAVDYFRHQRMVKVAYTQVVTHAFSDAKYDRPDSFLASLLKSPDISEQVVPQICIMQFPKTPISSGERVRLCNFLIQTLYENRATNTNSCNAIRSVLYFNDYPDVYTSETREMVKKLILDKKIHFFYADVVGVTADKEVRAYLMQIANEEGRYKGGSFNQTWLATCMLAKAGDKAARKKAVAEANNLRNLHNAMSVPLGMAYLGDEEMVLRLFKMLKSDLKEWNGDDVMPNETQLAHEAAIVLSLCVKDFPKYKSYIDFSAEDKAKCLKWVKENKGAFIIDNKPPLYYLKNTYFGVMIRR